MIIGMRLESINIECDLTNGPLSKLLELFDTQVQGSMQWVRSLVI